MLGSTAVIIVNWNGWADTVECLESLLDTISQGDQVIVCDNASTNQSLKHIQNWADKSESACRQALTAADGRKWVEYDRAQAEVGGGEADPQLVLVNTGANLGFAGANNVGLRYALARGHQFFWLLNGDTVVNSSSLRSLRQRMGDDPSIGMCGSTLVYFDQPSVIQAWGGASFDPTKGIGEHLGLGKNVVSLPERDSIEPLLDYVVGASMMVSRQFLEHTGLMCEEYFLYFEEIDWAVRSKGAFRLAWAPESIVLHKEGGSIGSNHRARPSDVSLFYMYRSRLLFAHRHTPELFWSVFRRIAFEAIVYIKRRDISAASIISKRLIGQLLHMCSAKN